MKLLAYILAILALCCWAQAADPLTPAHDQRPELWSKSIITGGDWPAGQPLTGDQK